MFVNKLTKKCMNDRLVAAALATLLSLLSNALRVSIAGAILFWYKNPTALFISKCPAKYE